MANEKRLIDAYALMEKYCEGCAKEVQEMCKSDPVCATMMWVVEEPTVDAVEVVHGRWTERYLSPINQVRCFCSECLTFHDYKSNYCPNCGAKMDGGLNYE